MKACWARPKFSVAKEITPSKFQADRLAGSSFRAFRTYESDLRKYSEDTGSVEQFSIKTCQYKYQNVASVDHKTFAET